jgi:hypothetical protein
MPAGSLLERQTESFGKTEVISTTVVFSSNHGKTADARA